MIFSPDESHQLGLAYTKQVEKDHYQLMNMGTHIQDKSLDVI
ncbi:hypothetical protein HALO59_50981 [Halomonas sp. 59]|nr:hypothetical protein HALO156_130100 [Halomonas sp. 156]CAD5291160.1 hypothetical protein HALO113_80985 [Halomonas sp. 113]CAD5292469.1 hypothetical protein HALO59_50981 [Halomonas sp. 59]CAD5296131.1 hypothetical protein HALOI3_70295 [Halomonas sp. I3]VXB57601.1 hypothetical protein HALO153_170005 [Halomonas titanicae]